MSEDEFRSGFKLSKKPIIALLPGNRKREIRTKLPEMLKVVEHFPDYQFVIAGSETMDVSLYEQFNLDHVPLIFGKTYDILNNASAALVTSGTATLETALFKVPQVVCYKPGWLTFQLMRVISTLKYICMVNLILDRKVVVELIETWVNEKRLTAELNALFELDNRSTMLEAYDELESKLGGTGASKRVAELMFEELRK